MSPKTTSCADGTLCPTGSVCNRGGGCSVPPTDTVVVEAREPVRDVDVLFVIDNSGSMTNEQENLVMNFPRFIEVLSDLPKGLPGLHIGVISSDLGVSEFNIAGCDHDGGDNGDLQTTPRVPGCSPPTDAYLSNVLVNGTAKREQNYTGSLAEAFACIAELGSDGCGFGQPLEAMKRALDGRQPMNAGFLRHEAALLVIIVTDEDDCSTFDNAMFDTMESATLGPLTDFRCFDFGVVCEPDTPRQVGPKSECTSREDSPYMHPIQRYIDFLSGLKATPEAVRIAVIGGAPEPVVVQPGPKEQLNRVSLEPSCMSANGEAGPPIRLKTLLDAFPERATLGSICDEDLSTSLAAIASGLGSVGDGAQCIRGQLYDVDPTTPGLQFECSVSQVLRPNTSEEESTQLQDCNNTTNPEESTNTPCYRIAPDAVRCIGETTELAVDIYTDAAVVPGSFIRAVCKV